MNRIVHIALKVDNLERTTQFYEKVFGFKESKTQKVRDHTSRHLSDGGAFGCKIISDPGVIPFKFRAPGGTVCEIVPKGRYRKSAKK